MSYTGMGLSLNLPNANLSISQPKVSTAPTGTSSSALAAASVDPALVTALSTLLTQYGQVLNVNDPARAQLILSGASLKYLKPNSAGKIPGDQVSQALNIMQPQTQTLVSNLFAQSPTQMAGTSYAGAVAAVKAMGVTSVSQLLAGIAANKFAALSVAPQPAPTFSLFKALPLTTKLTFAPAMTATTPPNPQTDQLCADGYYRDPSGMCLPVVTAPAASATPAVIPDQAQSTDTTAPSPADLTVPAEAASVPVIQPAAASSFPWMYVGIGAAGLAVVGGLYVMGRRKPTPNRRRKGTKSRGRKRTRRHSRRS